MIHGLKEKVFISELTWFPCSLVSRRAELERKAFHLLMFDLRNLIFVI